MLLTRALPQSERDSLLRARCVVTWRHPPNQRRPQGGQRRDVMSTNDLITLIAIGSRGATITITAAVDPQMAGLDWTTS